MRRPHKIGFVLYPQVSTVNLAVSSVFEMANWKAGFQAYQITLLSELGGAIPTSIGSGVQTVSFKCRSFDTLLVAGEHDPAAVAPPGVVRYLCQAGKRDVRIASICTGTFVLAEAGLLDGRRATTHWNHARELQKRYPKVKLELDRIFTNDGSIWCSAGMSAGIDLALALVEEDLGQEMARETAKLMVVYQRRAGGQSQHSTLLDLDAASDRVQKVLAFAKKNLTTHLSMSDLADVACVSPRQFSRIFRGRDWTYPGEGSRTAARGICPNDYGNWALFRSGSRSKKRLCQQRPDAALVRPSLRAVSTSHAAPSEYVWSTC